MSGYAGVNKFSGIDKRFNFLRNIIRCKWESERSWDVRGKKRGKVANFINI